VATSVYELDLADVDLDGLERAAAIEAMAVARQRHWLARVPFGFGVTRYEDVTAILRDRRFHSALSLLPQMAGIED